jgi:hypothetical protein
LARELTVKATAAKTGHVNENQVIRLIDKYFVHHKQGANKKASVMPCLKNKNKK